MLSIRSAASIKWELSSLLDEPRDFKLMRSCGDMWRHVAAICGVCVIYAAERYAEVTWPEVPANVWLAISLLSGFAMLFCLYMHKFAGTAGKGVSLSRSVVDRAKVAVGLRSVPMRGQEELKRFHEAFVEYLQVPAGPVIGNMQVAASDKFRPHIEGLCRLLDEQGIPHPDIPDGIVFDDTHKWGIFLAKLLAFRDDLEKARPVSTAEQN